MNELLHPAQVQALEKLKRLRVGALYIERQNGKLRTVIELVRYRLNRNRISGVLWLCTRRRVDLIRSGILRHSPDTADFIDVIGIESLSHNLSIFLELKHRVEQEPLMLIIDNGLLIKNPAALRTQRVLALSCRCPYRLLISDVPFSRHISDMFAQWYALDWRILGYSSYWGFCMNHLSSQNTVRNSEYLIRAIEPYCAQILRDDVQPVAGRREYVWQFPLPPEAMAEYRAVMDRFIWSALHSSTGVYRMLQACRQVACGRRISRDYPMETVPFYAKPEDNPRLIALMEVISHFENQRMLILYRYGHEQPVILNALRQRYGEDHVASYPEQQFSPELQPRLTIMNSYTDEREAARLRAEVIIYYSNDWNWRKRHEKERQCQGALANGTLTVVSLAAADTIDLRILKCIWQKESLVRQLRGELARNLEGHAPEQ